MLFVCYVIGFLLAAFALSFALGARSLIEMLERWPLGAFSILAIDALFGQILSASFSLVSAALVSVLNLLLAVGIPILSRRSTQAFVLSRLKPCGADVSRVLWLTGSYLVVLVFVIACAVMQFGPELRPNYASTDPGSHMYESMEVAESGALRGMFFTHYLTALWIQLLGDIVAPIELFRAFIISDLLLYLLGSWLVYVIINHVAGRGSHPFIALAITLLCIAGYPLNDIVYGFSYLGAGVSFIAALLYAALLYCEKPLRSVLLSQPLCLYGLCISYVLFIPLGVAFLVLFGAYIFREHLKAHKVMLIVAGSLIAVCSVLLIAWIAFSSGKVNALSNIGHSYNDLIGSFLPALPFVCSGIVLLLCKRPKSWWCLLSFLCVTIAAAIVFFVLYCAGKVSTYYYFKLYFVLWPAAFFVAASCFSLASKEFAISLKACLVIWMVLLGFSVSGTDDRLSMSRSDINPSPNVDSLFGVYKDNLREMCGQKISQEEVDIWRRANELSSESGSYVPLLGSNKSVYWYEGTTHNRSDKGMRHFQYWLYDDGERGSLLIDRLADVSFVAVLDEAMLPQEVKEYLDGREAVYSNESGTIYRLDAVKEHAQLGG